MPEIALHDMQRDAGVEQAGGLGVPEAMGPLKVDRLTGAVSNVQAAGEFTEPMPQVVGGVRAVTVAVHDRGQEQIFGRLPAGLSVGEEPVGPLLLLLDDRD